MSEIKIDGNMRAIFAHQRQKFVEEFGREPRANDPIFFDLNPMEDSEFEDALRETGLYEGWLQRRKEAGLPLTEKESATLASL